MRSMGHIAQLRNSSNIKKTHLQIALHYYTNYERKNIFSYLRIEWFLFVKSWIPPIQGCFVPSLVEIGPVVLEKVLKFSQWIFLYFVIISLIISFNKFESPSTKNTLYQQTWIPFTQGCFVPSLVEIGQVDLEKTIFKFLNVFSFFPYYLPLEKRGLHFNKFESPSPKNALCQDWMKSLWFWKRRIF